MTVVALATILMVVSVGMAHATVPDDDPAPSSDARARSGQTPPGARLQPAGPTQLSVGQDGRSFVTAEGRPFFWLADTAWSLFVNLDRDETLEYLDNRADKGFTVIQTVAISPPSGGLGPNAQGDRPYDDAIDVPAVTEGNDPADNEQYDYWDHIEFTIAEAAERGMYVALLPAWSGATAGESLTEANAGAYGEFLGARFGRIYDNLVWMAGGDDNSGFYPEIWSALASGIAIGATGRDDQDAILMSYHPGGGKNSATAFEGASWLDFNTHQSGHGPIDGNGSVWNNIDLSLDAGIPFLDSEPAYEEHPIDFDAANGYTTELDVRQYAYGSVFSGAAGHTYGHHNIWMMYGTERGGDGAEPKDISWQEAMDSPGAEDMMVFAGLMADHAAPRSPAQELITSETYDGTGEVILATRANDDSFVLVYSGQGREFTLSDAATDGRTASWFDPRTAETTAAEPDGASFTPPTDDEDWVLVLDGGSGPAPSPSTTVGGDAGPR